MEDDVKIEVKSVDGEVIIRHGDAKPINNPVQFDARATIEAPFKYFEKVGCHYPDVLKKAVVMFDRTNGVVCLNINPEDKLAAELEGVLVIDQALAGLKINQSSKFTADELCKYLRANPQLLVLGGDETVRSFTKKLLNLKWAVNQEFEKQNDDRGNILDNFMQKIKSDELPENLIIKGRFFKGSSEKTFTVELGLEASSDKRSLLFYLYSAEFELERQEEMDRLVGLEVKKFEEAKICVVESV